MLTVESGPFHPWLENAFIKRVLALKTDPLAPVAVVAPSGRLLERLQIALAGQKQAFMNITFHTFSSLAERVVVQDGTLGKPVLSDPLFFDTLVKFIIKSDRPFSNFDDLAIPDGFPMAVRATLRDLVDAGAPASIIEAVGEGFLGKDVDVGSLKQLLHLYRLYLDKVESLAVAPRSAQVRAAIEAAPTSTYLKGFKEILFYGFYDATGVQTDFFQAVVKHHPSRMYFPYDAENPAYAFARRFRDSYLQPVMKEDIVLAQDGPPSAPQFEVLNVSGLRDEAMAIARRLRRAHDDEKIPFSEMAVVARSRERLDVELPNAFRELSIPYFSSNERHLAGRPFFSALMTAVQARIESPEWPANTSWPAHATLAEEVLRASGHWDDIEPTFAQMQPFELLGKKVSKSDYFEALKERLARQILPRDGQTQRGVALLHAEGARGLQFRFTAVVGVEEKAFPRIIREDPFLRDDARMALTNGLGYKISQKMTAHEEERLLFEILSTSAREKLLFTYQRSDDEGAVVGPSPFLRAWAEKQGTTLDEIAVTIPRSHREKLKNMGKTASPRDLVAACLLSDQKNAALELSAAEPEALVLAPRLEAHEALQSFNGPGPYDGEVGEQNPSRLSATNMETYGHCPFQYFVKDVLGADPKEALRTPDQLDPRIKGKLVHGFFELFFKEATKNGTVAPPAKIPGKLFETTFDAVFSAAAETEAAVWPIIWQAFVISMKKQLHDMLEIDLKNLAQDGFVPAFFETRVSAQLSAPLDGVEWVGKMDRIDIGAGSARIIDYKSGGKWDDNVITPSLKGFRAQPSLYLLLCEQFLKQNKKPLAGVSFIYRYLKEPEMADELTWDDWQSYQKDLLETLRVQLTSLRAGHYPIIPGDYCDRCGLASICRKNDSLAVYRSQQGTTKTLLALRGKRK